MYSIVWQIEYGLINVYFDYYTIFLIFMQPFYESRFVFKKSKRLTYI